LISRSSIFPQLVSIKSCIKSDQKAVLVYSEMQVKKVFMLKPWINDQIKKKILYSGNLFTLFIKRNDRSQEKMMFWVELKSFI